jgi:5-methylcytosine-specific restriction enzyme A
MPSKPPSLRAPKPRPAPWSTSRRGSRQSRGYGRAHELMREQVLAEEPLCRECLKQGRVSATTIADHVIPKAEGGTDERDNYQGLCSSCDKVKTAAESARARARAR